MSEMHGPYHRTGEPGGPGCRVAVLPIAMKAANGMEIPAELLDAGNQATELELLRTIASAFGVRWGKDHLGWWAVVPGPSAPSQPQR